MNPFNKLSPKTRFVMAETARVVTCLSVIVIAEKVIVGGVRKLCGVSA